MATTNDDIKHYQRKIEKYSTDAKVLLHCLNKLTKLPIRVEHLQATGIGRTVNGMRKAEGPVGEAARTLVARWKEIVAAEDEKSDSDSPQEEVEDEAGDEEEEEEVENRREPTPEPVPAKASSSSNKNGSSSSSSSKHESSTKHKELKEKDKSSRKRRRSQSDQGVGGSFADALGTIDDATKKRKANKDKVRDKDSKKMSLSSTMPTTGSSHSASSSFSPPPVLPLKPIDIRSTDFEISPHYRPLSVKYVPEATVKDRAKACEEALSAAMTGKGVRTKVYSGARTSGLSSVPSLFDCCMRVLQQNVNHLETYLSYVGRTYVPYDVLKPVLERATAQQLYSLENCNPYLLDDSDELWKTLAQREFKKAVREEMETWREVYLRCHEERESRLKNLMNAHKQSMAKATPVRTTKLAYVESVARAPRGQVKQGASAVLASMTNAKAGARPFEASANGGINGVDSVAEVVKVGAHKVSSRSSSSSSSSAATSSASSSAAAAKKPKVAPLMQKTLKLMKNRFRR